MPAQIIASLASGLRDWREHGITVAEKIRAESADYLASEDRLGSALDEMLETDPDGTINLRDVRARVNEASVNVGLSDLKDKLERRGLRLDTGAGNKRIVRGATLGMSRSMLKS